MALSLVMAACGPAVAPTPTPTPNQGESTTPSATQEAPEPVSTPTPISEPTTTPGPVSYILSTSVNPPNGGSVSVSSGQFEQGKRIQVTVIPYAGYAFDHWSGDISGNNSAITLLMDSDKVLVANFADIYRPVITNVATTNITDTKITIKWDTNEPATSQVEHGITSAYGSISSDKQLVNSHSLTLSGLKPYTSYFFRIKSVDESGNEAIFPDGVFGTKYTWMVVSSFAYVEGGKVFYNLINDSSQRITVTKVELYDQSGIIRHLDQSTELGVPNMGKLSSGDILRMSFSSPTYKNFNGWLVRWYCIDHNLVPFTVSNSISP